MRNFRSSAPLLVLFFLIFIITAEAKNFYVDKSSSQANDNNPGTEALPFKTIQKGIDAAAAGDVVIVKYGIYSEKIIMRRSGTQTAPITIKAFDSSKRPVIDGTGLSGSRLVYWGSSDKNYITFDGFEIRNYGYWGIWIQGNYNKILNCKVYEIEKTAICVIGGNYNTIAYNEVFNIGDLAKNKIGNNIDIESLPASGKTANYNVVEFNKIYNNDTHFGVNIFPEASASAPQEPMYGNIIRNNQIDNCLGAIYTRYQRNFQIYNNLITNSLDNGIWLHTHYNAPSSANTFTANGKIFNNTIAYSENAGILNGTSNGLEIKNNVFIHNGNTEANGMEHVRMDKVSGHSINNNLYFGIGRWRWNGSIIRTFEEWKSKTGQDKLSIITDPKVQDLASGDYRLKAESPAIDKGVSLLSLFSSDMLGNDRPSGSAFDLGAYEYSANAPQAAPVVFKYYAKDGIMADGAGVRERYASFGKVVLYCSKTISSSKYKINVPQDGEYYVWGRFYYYSSTNSGPNAFHLQVDNGAKKIFGNYPAYKQFHWGGADGKTEKMSLGYLTAGEHTITIWGNETGVTVMLDMLVVTNNPNYVPQDSEMKSAPKEGYAADTEVPEDYKIEQNYPNPFNPTTIIKYALPEASNVSIKVYNILGAEMAILTSGLKEAGTHEVGFDGTGLPSGTYIYRIETDAFSQSRKMILLK